ESWAINGIPENPTAWLYTVAKNQTKDYFKHIAVFERQIKEAINPAELEAEQNYEFSSQNISDSPLAMNFAVCNPTNSTEARLRCLTPFQKTKRKIILNTLLFLKHKSTKR